jgi:hypothetical protein
MLPVAIAIVSGGNAIEFAWADCYLPFVPGASIRTELTPRVLLWSTPLPSRTT